MQRTHYLSDEHVHYKWDVENEPLVVIESGDTVVLETRDISDRQVGPESDASALDTFDWGRAYPLTGPIAVHDANPGDTLRIEILDVQTRGWGWTGVIPGFGLLTEEFSQGYVRTYDLSNGSFAYLREDIAVPLAPYFGTMGVCPDGAKDVSIIPPGRFGGNMDNRQLVRGSTLYLPVQTDQALFSCGDAHGAQGDGEVCGTAVEAPMYAALRITLEKGRAIAAPQYRTPAPLTPRVDNAPFFATMGVAGDLYLAAQDAVRAMIDHLVTGYALTPEDAYLLCSIAVDLKISEIVDGGQYIVSALLPEAVFAAAALSGGRITRSFQRVPTGAVA
jgi:acetamidase/formamidase